jgi:hypothetical protein
LPRPEGNRPFWETQMSAHLVLKTEVFHSFRSYTQLNGSN